MKYLIILLFACLLGGPVAAQENNDREIFRAMQDELDRNKAELQLPGFEKPFYLSYTVGMSRQFEVVGVLGSVTNSVVIPNRGAVGIQTLLGDYSNTSDSRYTGQMPRLNGAPGEGDYRLLRRTLWLGTDAIYKMAIREKAGKEAYLKANPLAPEEAALADRTPVKPIERLIERKTPYIIEQEKTEALVRELSAIFKEYKELFNSSVSISGFDMDVYRKTTEGVTVKVPMGFVSVAARATVRTDEGVSIADGYQKLLPTPQDLPGVEELKKDIRKFADNLMALKDAPRIDEFYSGPVLFEEGACVSIFSSTLLNQGGLFAYRKPASQQLQQQVKGLDTRMGRKIIDSRLSILNYTTLDKYNGVPLLGAYEIDAEGVVPEKEMLLVDKGILKQLLNGTVPAPKTTESTGSSRFVMNNSQISYVTGPGTIHIRVDKGTKQEQMKKALIKAAKEEGLDYAYIVRKVSGASSLIYRVDVKDGRETQVRFGDLSRIDLAKVKRLREISAKESVANYVLNQAIFSSMIYPSSLLIEDVEISQSVVKPEKEPVLKFPLQR